ncbi:MAG: hypothetical protein NTV56_05600 [Alphaproteobacteria bacterium]|nr:hypothetical protein [Alphaproteobacteria bacterium]
MAEHKKPKRSFVKLLSNPMLARTHLGRMFIVAHLGAGHPVKPASRASAHTQQFQLELTRRSPHEILESDSGIWNERLDGTSWRLPLHLKSAR